VLTAAYDGSFFTTPIQFNSPVTDKVLQAGLRAHESFWPCSSCVLTRHSSSLATPVHVQVEKQLARFYSLHITQKQLDEGFIISAFSTQSSKFKLLLFEATPDGRHELAFSVTSWDLNSSLRVYDVFHIADERWCHVCRRSPESYGRSPRQGFTSSGVSTAEAISCWNPTRDLAAAEECTDIAGRRQLTSEPLPVFWSCKGLRKMLYFGASTIARSGKFHK